MGHILSEIFPFLGSVFEHWQIWLSGGGIGGFLVITVSLVEKLWRKSLSRRAYVYLFLITFFLCACFLSWVDKNDALTAEKAGRETDSDTYQRNLEKWQQDYGRLNAECQYKSGVVDTLTGQNRDQENTINNCQTQALKLLTPPVQKTTGFSLEPAEEGRDKDGRPLVKVRYVLLTNKQVDPVDMIVQCEAPLSSVEVYPVPVVIHGENMNRIDDHTWEAQVESAWSPEAPLMADILYYRTDGIKSRTVCYFHLR